MTDPGFLALNPVLQHHVVATLGWRSLRPMQEQSIEPLLRGDHAVLSAPTAGGKTESALLPLLSRMIDERWHGLSVLYVCPLKALLNDLEPRVERLASFAGRTAAVWHGDVPAGARSKVLADPPDILLTTPESLEAMALSVRVDHERLLGGVQSVVVDEVHAFAGDDRGWHLLAMLARVDALLDQPAQRVGLTATVGNPDELLAWLVNDPQSSRRSSAVVVPPDDDGPAIDLEIDWVASVANAASVISRLHRGEKRLVFADSRARVEELATALRAQGITVFVSHSSLAAAERRDAEMAFREARDCVIVATSTLELGIDVGDLDRVIQLGAPATVASVLQRVGRTGRRPGTARNCLFLATRDSELLQALALTERIEAGWVEPLVAPARPVHLIAQQLLAGVLSQGRLVRSDGAGPLDRVLEAAGMRRQWDEIVEHAVENRLIVDDGGLLQIGPVGEDRYGFRHFIDVVSLFLSEPLLTVRYGRREIGSVDPSALARREDGRRLVLLLGGRPWAVGEIDWSQKVVWVEPTDDDGRIRWSGDGRALSFEVCQAQRRVLAGDAPSVEQVLTRRGRERLGELRDEVGQVPSDGTWLARDPKAGRAWWWTFAGGRANRQAAAALDAHGHRVGAVDDLRLSVPPTWSADAAARASLLEDIDVAIDDRRLDAVKFADVVPRSLLADMVEARDADAAALRWLAAASLSRALKR